MDNVCLKAKCPANFQDVGDRKGALVDRGEEEDEEEEEDNEVAKLCEGDEAGIAEAREGVGDVVVEAGVKHLGVMDGVEDWRVEE